jgi:hypothetical protein
MNVLGGLFKATLSWSEQVAKVVMKNNKSLNAIKIIRRFFMTGKLLKQMFRNYNLVLFYNSEIWKSPTLGHHSKQALLSASGNALRVCLDYQLPNVSFIDADKITKS